jgi:hypothetical protein
MPKLDDIDVAAGQSNIVWSHSASYRTNEYGRISPNLVNQLVYGQSYASVTNVLGTPCVEEPAINIGRIREHDAETAQWWIVYRHSMSDSIYYQMRFSGQNGHPARLLAIEAVTVVGDRLVSVGLLSMKGD